MIVIDSRALAGWFSEGTKFIPPYQRAINSELNNPDGQILISAVSLMDFCEKVRIGEITLSMPLAKWIKTLTESEKVSIVPLTAPIIELGESLKMPSEIKASDRYAVAIALYKKVELVTTSRWLREYSEHHQKKK